MWNIPRRRCLPNQTSRYTSCSVSGRLFGESHGVTKIRQCPIILRAPEQASAARGVLQHTLPASCWPASILFRFRPYLWSLFLLVYARLRHVPGTILHRYKNLAEESDFLNELHTVLQQTVLQKPNTPHLDIRSARTQIVKGVQRQ